MKTEIVVIVTGFFLFLFNTTWGDVLGVGFTRVDGLVPLVAWTAIEIPLPAGLLPVLVLGVLAETFSIITTGSYIIAYASEYLMVRYVLGHVVCNLWWQKVLLVFFVSLGVEFIIFTGSSMVEYVWPWGVVQAVLNGLLSPFWFSLFSYLDSVSVRSK